MSTSCCFDPALKPVSRVISCETTPSGSFDPACVVRLRSLQSNGATEGRLVFVGEPITFSNVGALAVRSPSHPLSPGFAYGMLRHFISVASTDVWSYGNA